MSDETIREIEGLERSVEEMKPQVEQLLEAVTWAGDIPFYLHIFRADGRETIIDVEEPQWATTYAEWMRGRSRWYLMVKESRRPVLAVDVMDDDQPYYAAKHIHRLVGRGAGGHIVAYGIGAKRKDGTTDRMWVLPNGIVCSGEDVMSLGEALLG